MTDLADPPVADRSDAHTEMPSLNGRKAIVTGGTTGIGRAIAVLLASEGAQVFICGRDPQHLGDARDEGAPLPIKATNRGSWPAARMLMDLGRERAKSEDEHHAFTRERYRPQS
jgi:NAD(P)-dependent dehydrogenase (short-subunit alcohol dehydrogenase family)